MISNSWLERRQPHWKRLESFISRVERFGLKNLDSAELRDFGLLYRQTAADLSAVRGERAARVAEEYLNRLVGRAHQYVYTGRKMTLRGFALFFLRDYPILFRALWRYVAIAVLVFLAGCALGAMLTLVRPSFMRAFLGPHMVWTIEHHQMWTDSIVSVAPQASAAIATNNISVTFATFAGGVLGGLGTLWLLFSNGLMMGVISTACAAQGMSLQLWSFVAGHGSLELPSIFIAGGAGLRLGWALLAPGVLRRKDALALAGAESIRLLLGTVPLLLIAGTVEAFLSPTKAAPGLKFAVGAALFSLLVFWLGFSRWSSEETTPEAQSVTAFRAL